MINFYSLIMDNYAGFIALVIIISVLSLYMSVKLRKKTSDYTGLVWFVIFILGFIFYFKALETDDQSIFTTMVVSFEYSLRMFAFNLNYQDIINIKPDIDPVLIFLISACFVAASLWSLIVVKNIFFKGVANNIRIFSNKNFYFIYDKIYYLLYIICDRMYYLYYRIYCLLAILFSGTFLKKDYLSAKLFPKRDEYHYIIIGCEKSMEIFLSNLIEERIRKNQITIITGEVIGQNSKSTAEHFKEFLEDGYAVIKGKADEAALEKAGINRKMGKTRVIAITECDEQNLAVADIVTQKIFTTIFPEELNLKDKDIDKFLNFLNSTIEAVKFIPKSDYEYNKLSDEDRKKEDDKKEKYSPKKQKIKEKLSNIYLEAHIMYSFVERTEHFTFAENAFGKVDFFNPYELKARDFFGKYPITSLIPSNFIDTDKARLKGNFNSNGKIYKPNEQEYLIKHIFVGFGYANYQMLKGSILTGQLFGCNYNATIYDENICTDSKEEKPSIKQAMFMNHSSGLFSGGDQTLENEEYFDSPKEEYNIVFKNGNALTKEFYTGKGNNKTLPTKNEKKNCLINEIKDNDFTVIYIALGEDKLSVETACEIRQCLYEYGIKQEKIRIFVKVCEESAFNSDFVINNPKNNQKDNHIKIERFGLNKSIFTKDHIISESLDMFARKVTNKNHDTPWEFLIETERDINRQVAMAIKTKLNLLGLDLASKEKNKTKVKNKDYEEIKKGYEKNYIGAGNGKISEIIKLSEKIAKLNNKIEITSEDNELEKLKDERSAFILDYVETENEQTGGKISDTPRNNLAQLEHLRWNTFHLIHGWTKMPKSEIGEKERKNNLTKQHACITTFDGLIELRNLQAEKKLGKKPDINNDEDKKAIAKTDTIWYDYNLMDELATRLEVSDKIITKINQNTK